MNKPIIFLEKHYGHNIEITINEIKLNDQINSDYPIQELSGNAYSYLIDQFSQNVMKGDFYHENTEEKIDHDNCVSFKGNYRVLTAGVNTTPDETEVKITSDREDIVDIYLDRAKHPVAYNRKKQELINAGMTESQAEEFIANTPFILEIFYDFNRGLFAIESEFVENCEVYNPHTGKLIPYESTND